MEFTKKCRISHFTYSEKDLIGKNDTYHTFRAVNSNNQENVLMKKIDIAKMNPHLHQMQNIELMNNINHHTLIRCQQCFKTKQNIYYFYQCFDFTLEEKICSKNLQQVQIARIIKQICQGMAYLIYKKLIYPKISAQSIVLIGDKIKFTQIFKITNLVNFQFEQINETCFSVIDKSLGFLVAQIGNLLNLMIKQRKFQPVSNSNKINFSLSLINFVKKCLIQSKQQTLFFPIFSEPYILSLNLNKLNMEQNNPQSQVKKETFIKEELKIMYFDKNLRLHQKPQTNCEDINIKKELKIKDRQQQMQLSYQFILPNVKRHYVKASKEFESQICWLKFLLKLNSWVQGFINQNINVNENRQYKCRVLYQFQFIILKQSLCQLNSLKNSILNNKNQFQIDKLSQLIKSNSKLSEKLKNSLENIQQLCQKMKTKEKFEKILNQIKIQQKNQRLIFIADSNFTKTTHLSLLGIHYGIKCIKEIWSTLFFSTKYKKILQKIKQTKFRDLFYNEFQEFLKVFLLLDYLVSYYLINCLIVDSEDSEHFHQKSLISIITNDMISYEQLNMEKIISSGLYFCETQQIMDEINKKINQLNIIK